MKKIIYLILLISFAGNAQISTTKEGFVKVKRKPIETSMVDSDSLNISKDDGIIRGIALSDFKGLLSITSGSTLIKVTAAEYLALSQTELDNNDYLIVDVKSAGSNDFMLKSEFDTNDDGTIDDVERLGGQLPSFYLDNTERTDEEIEDIIGTKVVAGSNVTVDYNDTTGETTISSTASGGSTDHGTLTGLDGDDHIQYFNQARGDARYLQTEVDGSVTNELQTISKSGSTVTLSGGGGSFTDANTQLSDEEVQDKVGAMVSGNTENNISVTYNDTTGKLDFNVTGSTTQTTGTFTPSLSGTYSSYDSSGYYVKTGNVATVWIEFTNVTSATNQSISITGLPAAIMARVDGNFTHQQSTANVRVTGNSGSDFTNALGVFPQNLTQINITSKDFSGDVSGTISSGTIQVTATYITN